MNRLPQNNEMNKLKRKKDKLMVFSFLLGENEKAPSRRMKTKQTNKKSGWDIKIKEMTKRIVPKCGMLIRFLDYIYELKTRIKEISSSFVLTTKPYVNKTIISFFSLWFIVIWFFFFFFLFSRKVFIITPI